MPVVQAVKSGFYDDTTVWTGGVIPDGATYTPDANGYNITIRDVRTVLTWRNRGANTGGFIKAAGGQFILVGTTSFGSETGPILKVTGTGSLSEIAFVVVSNVAFVYSTQTGIKILDLVSSVTDTTSNPMRADTWIDLQGASAYFGCLSTPAVVNFVGLLLRSTTGTAYTYSWYGLMYNLGAAFGWAVPVHSGILCDGIKMFRLFKGPLSGTWYIKNPIDATYVMYLCQLYGTATINIWTTIDRYFTSVSLMENISVVYNQANNATVTWQTLAMEGNASFTWNNSGTGAYCPFGPIQALDNSSIALNFGASAPATIYPFNGAVGVIQISTTGQISIDSGAATIVNFIVGCTRFAFSKLAINAHAATLNIIGSQSSQYESYKWWQSRSVDFNLISYGTLNQYISGQQPVIPQWEPMIFRYGSDYTNIKFQLEFNGGAYFNALVTSGFTFTDYLNCGGSLANNGYIEFNTLLLKAQGWAGLAYYLSTGFSTVSSILTGTWNGAVTEQWWITWDQGVTWAGPLTLAQFQAATQIISGTTNYVCPWIDIHFKVRWTNTSGVAKTVTRAVLAGFIIDSSYTSANTSTDAKVNLMLTEQNTAQTSLTALQNLLAPLPSKY